MNLTRELEALFSKMADLEKRVRRLEDRPEYVPPPPVTVQVRKSYLQRLWNRLQVDYE